MNSSDDSRKSKTRAALVRAFNNLFFEDPDRDIRVADVTTQAEVGRSTFYEHFSSIEDLHMQALSHPMSILADVIAGNGDKDKLIWLLQHFKENQQRARKTMGGPRHRRVTRVLVQLLDERLRSYTSPTLSKPLVLQHMAAGPLELIKSWVAGENWATEEELAMAIIETSQLSRGGLLNLPSSG